MAPQPPPGSVRDTSRVPCVCHPTCDTNAARCSVPHAAEARGSSVLDNRDLAPRFLP